MSLSWALAFLVLQVWLVVALSIYGKAAVDGPIEKFREAAVHLHLIYVCQYAKLVFVYPFVLVKAKNSVWITFSMKRKSNHCVV